MSRLACSNCTQKACTTKLFFGVVSEGHQQRLSHFGDPLKLVRSLGSHMVAAHPGPRSQTLGEKRSGLRSSGGAPSFFFGETSRQTFLVAGHVCFLGPFHGEKRAFHVWLCFKTTKEKGYPPRKNCSPWGNQPLVFSPARWARPDLMIRG